MHITIRGFSDIGYLQFTCHMTHDPAKDKAWIYCVSRSGRAEVRRATSKLRVAVEMQMLKKESKKSMFCYKLEPVPSKVLSFSIQCCG